MVLYDIGEWDGLGGMLKQWIRQRAQSRLQVSGTKVTMPKKVATTSGLMASALDCFEAWQGHFETGEWRAAAVAVKRPVTGIYFHWAGLEDIVRPPTAQYEVLEGISHSYQFFMLRQGAVLMRRHSCWCKACFAVAMGGPGEGTCLTSDYEVPACERTGADVAVFYQWHNASCRAKAGGEVAQPDKRAREHGHALAAAGMVPGEWVLAECFGDEEDEMWLGKTVAGFEDGSCAERHTGLQATEYKVAFHDGDYKVAVQWYERLVEGGSSERREFKMGKPQIDVINSTELRAYGFHVDVLSVGPPLRPGARSAERAARLADAEEHRHWRLPCQPRRRR